MERIAWEIGNQVSKSINVRAILRDTKAKQKIQESKLMLEKWKQVQYIYIKRMCLLMVKDIP